MRAEHTGGDGRNGELRLQFPGRQRACACGAAHSQNQLGAEENGLCLPSSIAAGSSMTPDQVIAMYRAFLGDAERNFLTWRMFRASGRRAWIGINVANRARGNLWTRFATLRDTLNQPGEFDRTSPMFDIIDFQFMLSYSVWAGRVVRDMSLHVHRDFGRQVINPLVGAARPPGPLLQCPVRYPPSHLHYVGIDPALPW